MVLGISYRSKEAQGHWKEYDVTTTYNPPNIQKVRMDPERRVVPIARRGKAMNKIPRQEYNEHLLELADNL